MGVWGLGGFGAGVWDDDRLGSGCRLWGLGSLQLGLIRRIGFWGFYKDSMKAA